MKEKSPKQLKQTKEDKKRPFSNYKTVSFNNSLLKNYNQILGLGAFNTFGVMSDICRVIESAQRPLGLYTKLNNDIFKSLNFATTQFPKIHSLLGNYNSFSAIQSALSATQKTLGITNNLLGDLGVFHGINSIAQTITIPEVMIQNSLRSFSTDLNQITKIIGNQIQDYDEQDEYSSEELERITKEIQLKFNNLLVEKTLSIVDYVKIVADDILNDIKSIKLKAVIYFVLFIVIENSITSFINRQFEDCSNPHQAVNAQISLAEKREAIQQNPNLNKELISNYKLIKFWVSARTSKTAGSPNLECLKPGTVVRVIEKQKKWSLIEWKYSDSKESAVGFVRSKYLVSAWK